MRTRAVELVLVGVLLFGLTVAGSALVAPDRSTPAAADGAERTTLVGSQGGGPGWHEYGSVYLLNGTDVEWREDSADSYFDVQRLPDGRVLAGFMDGGTRTAVRTSRRARTRASGSSTPTPRAARRWPRSTASPSGRRRTARSTTPNRSPAAASP
ncbi:hypothetical protein ACFQRB_01170 [Halobaculum litoreum]|uniref:Uncharacterized protein n=1 Tax=Halobaculum litoreum TaxID=3031998 RepID=A0ABD5XPW3_9EURY